MKLPPKIISILFILLFSISGKSQNSNQNTFSIKLNIPVFIDEMLKTDYVKPTMQDNSETYSNKKTSFSFGQNYCPLNYSDNQFWGSHINENFPYEKITIKGCVSDDHMTLEKMYVSMEWHVNDESRKESEVVELNLENVPMFDGYCFFDKSKSKIKLQRYEYSKTETRRGFSTSTHTKSGITINLDDIPAKPMLAKQKLYINLKMDGPPSYIVNVETIWESNASWEPPASLVSPEYFITDNEPNSIGFYQDIKGLNNESEMWTNYASNQLYIYNIPGLKVLERKKIENLTQEADLSQSGLVNPETGIDKGSFMKEEVAVIVKVDLSIKVIEYIIQSKKSEQKITVTDVTPENMIYATKGAKKQVYSAINKSLTNPLIPITDR